MQKRSTQYNEAMRKHLIAVIADLEASKPSARKSYGEFKPVLVNSRGQTKILGQRGHVQRVQPQTKFYEGPTEIYHARRGKTFPTGDEAKSFVANEISTRLEVAKAHLAVFQS